MILNSRSLLAAQPIKNMLDHKVSAHGVSHGLGEAGYDIRIKQEIRFYSQQGQRRVTTRTVQGSHVEHSPNIGRFVLASAIEEFNMPTNLVGIVHDKSTWARRGLQVFNTVIEPGWKGFLTLELAYWGDSELIIPAGAGIAQVVFHETTDRIAYSGKYQEQEDEPVPARKSV